MGRDSRDYFRLMDAPDHGGSLSQPQENRRIPKPFLRISSESIPEENLPHADMNGLGLEVDLVSCEADILSRLRELQ